MTAPARVLVVDDSATMRGLISAVLNADPDITVVGQAADALEARQAIKQLDPDVVTLDIEMPNMNGLEFLDKIMRLRPMPVIMVSTLTHKGAEATIAALEIGAFDCVGKPQPGDTHPFRDLADKVKAAARSQRKSMITSNRAAAPAATNATCFRLPGRAQDRRDRSLDRRGRGADHGACRSSPPNCPPTVITQHMPHTFTKSFAERLNRLCAPTVQEATDGARLEVGRVYLAPGRRAPSCRSLMPTAPCCRLVDRPIRSTDIVPRSTCCSIRSPNWPAATPSGSFSPAWAATAPPVS